MENRGNEYTFTYGLGIQWPSSHLNSSGLQGVGVVPQFSSSLQEGQSQIPSQIFFLSIHFPLGHSYFFVLKAGLTVMINIICCTTKVYVNINFLEKVASLSKMTKHRKNILSSFFRDFFLGFIMM